MRLRLLAFLAGVTVAASGCAGAPKPRYPHQDADVALAQHRAEVEQVTSLRAEARVDQRGDEGRIRGTVLMFLEAPNRVRFDALTQFGPAAVLTSDGERFELFDMREERFLVGPTCPENIARLLGIALSAESVVRFLRGDSPQLDPVNSSIRAIRGGYEVKLRDAAGNQQLLTFGLARGDEERQPADQELRLSRVEQRDAQGAVVYRAEYDDHRAVDLPGGGSVTLPFVVRFEDPSRGRDVRVRFKSIEPNVEVPAEAFHQPTPGGITAEVSPCAP